MLYKVEATNVRGDVLSLPFDSFSNGFVVKDIDGLGPVKASLVSSSFAGVDGTQYQSARRDERNVVVKLELKPDYISTTVRALRTQLYSFFMTKTPVTLKFYDTEISTVARIDGRIESCQPSLFDRNPTIDISIICFDPDFVDVTGYTSISSTISGTTETPLPYDGTVDAGLTFTLNVNRTLGEFVLYLRGSDNVLQSLDVVYPFLTGDVVKINTIRGQKAITLTRSGTTSSILYAKQPTSAWLTLQQGDNKFRAYAAGAGVPYTLSFNARYGGL